MCLTNNIKYVKQILKRKNDRIVCYKLLKTRFGLYQGESAGKTYTVSPLFSEKKWEFGIVKSNSRRKKVCLKSYEGISNGIHVCKTKEIAQKLFMYTVYQNCYIVKLYAHKSDLLGANRDQMVFKKVYFPEQ